MRILELHCVDDVHQYGGVEAMFLGISRALASRHEVALAISDGEVAEKARKLGVPVFRLGPPQAGVAGIWFGLGRALRAFRPDVVHSHHRRATLVASAFRARGRALIHTFHVEQFNRRWLRAFGTHATAVSHGVKDHFMTHFGVPDERITVVHNGIDDVLSGGPVSAPEPGRVRAVVVGRLEEQKGHGVLLDALARLAPEVRARLGIDFVGDGSLREALESQVSRLGLQEVVRFRGFQADPIRWLRAADFSLMPSLWEGFGLSAVESMLCERPVIASAVGGLPEVVQNGETGLLVPPGDVRLLSEAIQTLAKDPERVARMGRAGRKFALANFSVSRMIEGYEGVFRRFAGHA